MKMVGLKPELQMPSSALDYTSQCKCHITKVKKIEN